MTRAVVVGSGPNGLSAALTLAKAGVQVDVLEAAPTPGGGTRSGQFTLPGLVHDECSGFHPLAVDNRFVRSANLEAYGLKWLWPEVQYAHPLDGGRGAAAFRSVADTVMSLGPGGKGWDRVFGPLVDRFDKIADDVTQPMLRIPSAPFAMARFGTFSLLPASVLAQAFGWDEARALFGGVAAHAMRPLNKPVSSAIGVALGVAAHRYGWPVAEGGSAAITTAMVRALEDLGAKVTTDARVESLRDIDDVDIVLLDVAPSAAADIVGDRLPPRVAKALRRYKHGPGVFKIDYALDGGVPWMHPDSHRAGTVHVGGTFEEIAASERQVAHGDMPERPFVLVGQQYLADATRATGSLKPLYAYAHVPAGYTGDATVALEAQIERFAPGFRDRIVARHVTAPNDFARLNANYIGGDVVTGLNTPTQLVFRPRPAVDPYSLGVPGVYLCSAATPPGAGAHGMCGYNAAMSALKHAGVQIS